MTPLIAWLTLATLQAPTLHSQQTDKLYRGDNWASVASDNKASDVGDTLTIVIFESASATNRVGNSSEKSTDLGASAGVDGGNVSIGFGVDGSYRGGGATERSDRFVATMTATVVEILPNGDLMVQGKQQLVVNDEERDIKIRGQVRAVDISPYNTIVSSRLANAAIDYDGRGYVTRSAKPGLINRILSFLGLA